MLSIKIGILESFRFEQIIKGSAEPANLNKDLKRHSVNKGNAGIALKTILTLSIKIAK